MGFAALRPSCRPKDTLQQHDSSCNSFDTRDLDIVWLGAFFDRHVLEFAGLEHLAALETLDVFGVLVTADDLHTRVLTLVH